MPLSQDAARAAASKTAKAVLPPPAADSSPVPPPALPGTKEVTAAEPDRPRLVAGAIGPTNRTLSISPSVIPHSLHQTPAVRSRDHCGVADHHDQIFSSLQKGLLHALRP